MTERIILHIGLPKSASTTIQDWSLAHRTHLQTFGIAYPKSKHGAANPRHQELVQGLLNGNQTWLRQTIAENTCPTLFLCSDNCCGLFGLSVAISTSRGVWL